MTQDNGDLGEQALNKVTEAGIVNQLDEVEDINVQDIAFTAVPHISSDRQQVQLDQVEYTQGQEPSPEITDALLNQTHELLDLGHFELEGMQLYLTHLKITPGKMSLICEAQITEFASS